MKRRAIARPQSTVDSPPSSYRLQATGCSLKLGACSLNRGRWTVDGGRFYWVVGALVALAFPLLDSNPYHIEVLTGAGLYALLAVGLNIAVSYTHLTLPTTPYV